MKTLSDASADLGGVSENQIFDAIRKVRSQRKPELTVVAEAAETATT